MQHADHMKAICSEIKGLKQEWRKMLMKFTPEQKKEYLSNKAWIAFKVPRQRSILEFSDSDEEPEIHLWNTNYPPLADFEIETARKLPHSKKLWLHK